MQEQLIETGDSVIVFDAGHWPHVNNNWFIHDFWRRQGALHMQPGGRGGVAVITMPDGECVLRHYRRGGQVARLLGDRYLWYGATRTRSFAEFRLLAEIQRRQLPAPAAVAARYVRHGLFYRADLITTRIADVCTLGQCLTKGKLDAALAEAVGALIALFHREGICHADLNAHNILVSTNGPYLIDFDRASMRPDAVGWRRGNLKRLRRSLLKLYTHGKAALDAACWTDLLHGYTHTLNR